MTAGHVGWAVVIFVMERRHLGRLGEKFGRSVFEKRVICLDIPDDYPYMDEELIEILRSRVSDYIIDFS